MSSERRILAVSVKDLSGDRLLAAAPRVQFNTRSVPALGGIPLLAKLGQGGMGAVYYGIHPRLRREVAVKVLPCTFAENYGAKDRFYREAQIAANVKSPNIVSVIDVNEECGIIYYVMEFVNGASAQRYRMDAGSTGLPETDALDICISATEGLASAHDAGVIHRDIKPDNILLPRNAETSALDLHAAKLADLGLARTDALPQGLTGAGTTLGTPGYMSPEQAEADMCGKPSDIFSMGATLYALLSGHAPFENEALFQVLKATVDDPHKSITEWRPDISHRTCQLIDRCLNKDPDKRFQDAPALLSELKMCRTESTCAPAPPRIAAPVGVSKARHSTLVKSRAGTPPAKNITAGKRPAVYIAAAAIALAAVLAGVRWRMSGKKAGGPNAGTASPASHVETGAADTLEASDNLPDAVAGDAPGEAAQGNERGYAAFSNAVAKAAEARRSENWRGIKEALEGPLAAPQNANHSERLRAESLLREAATGLKRDADFDAQLALARRTLAGAGNDSLKKSQGLAEAQKAVAIKPSNPEALALLRAAKIAAGDAAVADSAAVPRAIAPPAAAPAPASRAAPLNEGAVQQPVSEQVFSGHAGKVTAIAFLAKSGQLVTGSNSNTRVPSGKVMMNHPGGDNTVRFWDLNTGGQIGMIKAGLGQRTCWGVHGLSISRDQTQVAVATCRPTADWGEPTVTVWSAEDRSSIQHFNLKGRAGVWTAWFSRDGASLYAFRADTNVHIFDLKTGQETLSQKLLPSAHENDLRCTRMLNDTSFVIGGMMHGPIKVWSLPDGKEVKELLGHTKEVRTLALSADEKLLASASVDGTARVWELSSSREIMSFPHGGRVHSVAFVNGSARIVTAGEDKTAVLWNVADGSVVKRFEGHTDVINCLAVSPDGRILATGSSDKTARTWRLPK